MAFQPKGSALAPPYPYSNERAWSNLLLRNISPDTSTLSNAIPVPEL